MKFDCELGIKTENQVNLTINHRTALRAVIMRDNHLLMVQTNRGDVKFPGGGANSHEEIFDTIKREVSEETGYIVSHVEDLLGVVTETYEDSYQKDSLFQMESSYYLCMINTEQSNQKLDDYELEQEFMPVWLTIQEAIMKNENILKNKNTDMNSWVNRETEVLKRLDGLF